MCCLLLLISDSTSVLTPNKQESVTCSDTIKHTHNTHTMGLTKKAKILLGGLAGALLLVVVIVPLVVLSGRQSTDAEGRERLRNIDLSLQRSARKMLDLVEEVEAQASRRVARDVNMMELRLVMRTGLALGFYNHIPVQGFRAIC